MSNKCLKKYKNVLTRIFVRVRMNIEKGDDIMKIMKNRWMITFVVVFTAITYFGTLLTANSGVEVSDIHNAEYQSNM